MRSYIGAQIAHEYAQAYWMYQKSVLFALTLLHTAGLFAQVGEKKPCTALAKTEIAAVKNAAKVLTESGYFSLALDMVSDVEDMSAGVEISTEAEVCAGMAARSLGVSNDTASTEEWTEAVEMHAKYAEVWADYSEEYAEDFADIWAVYVEEYHAEAFAVLPELPELRELRKLAKAHEAMAASGRFVVFYFSDQAGLHAKASEAYTALSKESTALADIAIPMLAETYTVLADMATGAVEVTTKLRGVLLELMPPRFLGAFDIESPLAFLLASAELYSALAEKASAMAENLNAPR